MSILVATMKSDTLPLLVLLGALVLSACKSVDPNGATRTEKTEALSAHLTEWKPATLVNQFARPRTAQIFNNLLIDHQNREIDASSTGQATILTPDGYALTAAHVLADGPLSILTFQKPRPGTLALTAAGPVFYHPANPERPTKVRISQLESRPIRLVKRFQGTDLALVKLPTTSSQTFQLSKAPPAEGATLFAYGSNLSGNSSAGKSLGPSRRLLFGNGVIRSVVTSIPLQKGDSGGPVMNDEGALVGIISRGRSNPFAGKFTSTEALWIDSNYLAKIIDLDRSAP
jgi:S1-C subfamily serine protease